jgi:hypothetical protein
VTYRERREAKAERLQEWAAKRHAQAVAQLSSQPEMRHDWAFVTQPGHIPQRARMIAADERAFRSMDKADAMLARADGIASQLDSSIYSDDPDAVERLEERIAKLEAKRDAIKTHNKTHRNGSGCTCPEGCGCRSRFEVTRCDCTSHPLPGYVLANLSSDIKRNRDRLDMLQRQARRAVEAEEAGGTLIRPLPSGYVSVTFAEKPDSDVRAALKTAGFRFGGGSWVGSADRLPESVR